MNPFTILSGDETLAAEITETPAGTYTVRLIDEETRRDAGIEAVVETLYGLDIDLAVRHANAWVTQTPVNLPARGDLTDVPCEACGRLTFAGRICCTPPARRADCRNCGGDGYTVDAPRCPACQGRGR